MYRSFFASLTTPLAGALALATMLFNEQEYLVGGTGAVRAIYDQKDASRIRVLDQSDTVKQVAVPASHANFGGARCFAFTRAQYYGCSDPAASFQFLHGGNSGIYGVLTPTDVSIQGDLLNTRGGNGTGLPGCEIRVTTAPALQYLSLSSPSAGGVNQSRSITLNTPTQFSAQWLEGTSPEYALKTTGQSELTGDSAGAPDPTPSGATLFFGGTLLGTNLLHARVWGFALTPALSAGDRAAIRSELESLTTVAA